MTTAQFVQAIDEAYATYVTLFNSTTSTVEEQNAAFEAYQQLRNAYDASR